MGDVAVVAVAVVAAAAAAGGDDDDSCFHPGLRRCRHLHVKSVHAGTRMRPAVVNEQRITQANKDDRKERTKRGRGRVRVRERDDDDVEVDRHARHIPPAE